jgi:signal transduction histidine kinase
MSNTRPIRGSPKAEPIRVILGLKRFRLIPVGAGITWAVAVEAARFAAGWPVSWVLTDFVPGAAFLVAGAVAWNRRPDSRIGPLMVAAGFAWYAGPITLFAASTVDRLGYAFHGYYDGLLAWLVLAYPTGRLPGRAARLVVAALFVALGLRSVFRLFAFRLSTDYDFAAPGAVDQYIADVSFREAGDVLLRLVISGLAVVVLALLVRRLVTETSVARRIAAPMVLAGMALVVGVVVESGAVSLANTPTDRFAAWDLGTVLTNVTGVLVAFAFVIGLARSRLAKSSVADLVMELGDPVVRSAIRDLIARALRDPSVELLYPVPDSNRFVDADGREGRLPDASSPDRAVTRLESGGRLLAVLVHDPAIAEQPELVRSVAAAARLAIENERLAAEVRAQLDEVRASRARIVAAGDEQRRRIERDLHDGAQQRLVTLALRLQTARTQLNGSDPVLANALDEASHEMELALAELRQLARGLHPNILAAEGLRAAIEMLADRSPVPTAVVAPDTRFPPAVESSAYFVVAEGLTNMMKYARATHARVSVTEHHNILTVEVADDGGGGADPDRGSGLRGLEDRVAAIGGRLTVTSEPGRGTTVRADIPCG